MSGKLVLLGVVVALAVPVGAGSAPDAGSVAVNATIAGQFNGSIKGSNGEDPKDTIPARNACTRFTKPNFASRSHPLAYNVSFDNQNVVSFKRGLFFAFYYDPKQVGRAQKLDKRTNSGGGASLLAIVSKNAGFSLAAQGWNGTVTLNKDLRSGSFTITGVQSIIGTDRVTIRGTWRCSVTFVRVT